MKIGETNNRRVNTRCYNIRLIVSIVMENSFLYLGKKYYKLCIQNVDLIYQQKFNAKRVKREPPEYKHFLRVVITRFYFVY